MKRPRVDEEGSHFYFVPALPCDWQWVEEHNVIRLRKPFIPVAHLEATCLVKQLSELCWRLQGPRWFERIVLLDRVYHAYETHVLALDEHETTLLAVFVLNEPNEAHWMVSRYGQRFMPLSWFPPDVDPTLYGLKVDARRIPQRTPLWFKMRGQVTGTKAYTLMGYWVPSTTGWTLDEPKTFSPQAQEAMQLGTDSEYIVECAYMSERPGCTLSAVGWCDAPVPLYPRGWGASPDALIRDSNMSWNAVPPDIQKYYAEPQDVAQGVLEIKTSRKSLAMEPYFLPQVYMEMIATGTIWCDLVRYKPAAGGKGGGTARIYRIYRHRPTEELITGLIKIALATPAAQLQDLLLKDQRWSEARDFLKAVAKQLPFVEMVVDASHETEWKAYKASLYEKEVPAEPQATAEGGALQQAIKKLREVVELLETL